MNSILRLRALPSPAPRLARPFHSPFAALASSAPRTAPPAPHHVYEKQADHSPDPHVSHAGTRTYVVSAPDASHNPYQVPSGAYPTSAPYNEFLATEGEGGASAAVKN